MAHASSIAAAAQAVVLRSIKAGDLLSAWLSFYSLALRPMLRSQPSAVPAAHAKMALTSAGLALCILMRRLLARPRPIRKTP
jgi:hypothetical protein